MISMLQRKPGEQGRCAQCIGRLPRLCFTRHAPLHGRDHWSGNASSPSTPDLDSNLAAAFPFVCSAANGCSLPHHFT